MESLIHNFRNIRESIILETFQSTLKTFQLSSIEFTLASNRLDIDQFLSIFNNFLNDEKRLSRYTINRNEQIAKNNLTIEEQERHEEKNPTRIFSFFPFLVSTMSKPLIIFFFLSLGSEENHLSIIVTVSSSMM